MPGRSIWVCPFRYRRLSTASVASLLRQNSEPAIADNALFPRLFRASQVYICRKTFGYLLSSARGGGSKVVPLQLPTEQEASLNQRTYAVQTLSQVLRSATHGVDTLPDAVLRVIR